MFARSEDLVDECDLTFLHVFPYSKRPGTPAARMPQVAGEAIKERAKRLRASGEAALQRRLAAEVGATREVLIESDDAGPHGAFPAGGDIGRNVGCRDDASDQGPRWRAVDGVILPSPLVGEGGAKRRMRGLYPRSSRAPRSGSPLLRISDPPSPTRGEGISAASLPVPPARPEPLPHMLRRRRHHAHRLLVLRNRNHDLAGMQMQDRLAEARAVAINVVADDRPAHG